jgi:hypothetical protein
MLAKYYGKHTHGQHYKIVLDTLNIDWNNVKTSKMDQDIPLVWFWYTWRSPFVFFLFKQTRHKGSEEVNFSVSSFCTECGKWQTKTAHGKKKYQEASKPYSEGGILWWVNLGFKIYGIFLASLWLTFVSLLTSGLTCLVWDTKVDLSQCSHYYSTGKIQSSLLFV